MTKVKAKSKWVRIPPRKASLVMGQVRGKSTQEALQILRFMPQKGARLLEKLIKSAVANAKHNYKLHENELVISEIYANKGIVMKRWQARAKGRAFPINKRTSHLTVTVAARENKNISPKATKEEA